MSRILIADRDQTERTGMAWFIRSYQIRFEQIDQAVTIEDVIEQVERYSPSVVCIELEMIPPERLTEVMHLFQRYVKTVICLTTEAVFERALQAIELHTFALLVKPVSPARLKETFVRAFQRSTSHPASFLQEENMERNLSYESLFIDYASNDKALSLILLQPEESKYNKALYQWINEYPFPSPVQCFALSDMVACLLALPHDEEHTYLLQEGHRLLHRWREEKQVSLNVAIHLSTMPTGSLHHTYIRTKEALKMRFFKGNQQLFWVDEMSGFLSIDPFLTPDEQRTWMKHLEQGDKQGIKAWLYDSFTQFPSGYPEPDLLRIRLTSILAQLRRFMQTYYLEQQSELEGRYHKVFQLILYHPVLFGIVQEVLLFCFALIDGAEQQKQEAATDFIERGLQYMEQNYHRPQFALEDVAQAVGRSASYFSHLLSQRKGKTFRQLLTEIRLQQAKAMLRESTSSVQEIADQIGYTDPNYFSRVFKEGVGVSPRVYRQQEKNKRKVSFR
jgi:two-component system response regulator YesN